MSTRPTSSRSQPPGKGETGRPLLTSVPVGEARKALAMYRTMRLVREVELTIESLHKRGVMTGSFHSSIGQEACAVGVCSALEPEDLVTSTHRGHGHAVAKGVPIEGIFAELLGRQTGVSGGRGGSMHLHHRESGFVGENAIVGGGLPCAAGAAWARRRLHRKGIAVAFTGDGGVAEGIFHETLLLARFWESPCLIVCENNGLAHSMPSERLFGEPGSIARMVEATGVTARFVDGRDVLAVRDATEELLTDVRRGRPAFMECGLFRVRPHSIADPDYRYRTRGVGEEWLEANDPIARMHQMFEPSAASELAAIDTEIQAIVESSLEAAQAAEPTPVTDARSHIYATAELQAYSTIPEVHG
jgi:TPP-dependent pyruvate/acetoin dehydrogenase alpha subunit